MGLRGTILHVASFDESSRVVEVLTATQGRLVCVARGARASKKRFPGGLDVFTTLELEVTPQAGMWRLDSAQLLLPRVGIRRSLEAFERAGRLTECARALTNVHQPSPEQTLALEDGLDACDRGELVAAVASYPRLLTAAGIWPDEVAAASSSSSIADKIELMVLDLVEAHLGHPLKTRVTPLRGDGKRASRVVSK